MNRTAILDTIEAAQALIVACLLLVAGSIKALDTVRRPGPSAAGPDALSAALGARLSGLLAPPLAGAEIAVALWLLSGRARIAACLTASVLLVVAAPVLIYGRARRPDARCGCFGKRSRKPVNTTAVARPLVLAALALGAAFADESWTAMFHHVATILLAGLELLIVWIAVPELRRSPRQTDRDRAIRRAIRAVKRSGAFHDLQHQLLSSHPSDAWIDPESSQRVVVFDLGGPAVAGSERVLAFAVDPRRAKVRAVGEVVLAATTEGWRASHHALSTATSPSSSVCPGATPASRATM